MSAHLEGRPVSASTYRNNGCRCPDCTKAATESNQARRLEKTRLSKATGEHQMQVEPSASCYRAGCRCRLCTDLYAVFKREQRGTDEWAEPTERPVPTGGESAEELEAMADAWLFSGSKDPEKTTLTKGQMQWRGRKEIPTSGGLEWEENYLRADNPVARSRSRLKRKHREQ